MSALIKYSGQVGLPIVLSSTACYISIEYAVIGLLLTWSKKYQWLLYKGLSIGVSHGYNGLRLLSEG